MKKKAIALLKKEIARRSFTAVRDKVMVEIALLKLSDWLDLAAIKAELKERHADHFKWFIQDETVWITSYDSFIYVTATPMLP